MFIIPSLWNRFWVNSFALGRPGEIQTALAIVNNGEDTDTQQQKITFKNVKLIAQGTFGFVYKAVLVGKPGCLIAIKKVEETDEFKVSYTHRNKLTQLACLKAYSTVLCF